MIQFKVKLNLAISVLALQQSHKQKQSIQMQMAARIVALFATKDKVYMPKSYNIAGVIKENGVIQYVTTAGGMNKTKEQVIQDINNGYSVYSLDNHGHKTPVINVDIKYVRTVPTSNECDNLGNL